MKRTLICGTEPAADAALLDLARESAVRLLGRSISFGHGRLAVIRLAIAVNAGAQVPEEFLTYCRNAALKIGDTELLATCNAAERKYGQRPVHVSACACA